MPDRFKWFFEFQYRFGKPRWDTGITPPEVVNTIEAGNGRKGRALDLGCGTGTNSIYLARNGFQVVGVDFSPKAMAKAREKIRGADVSVDLHVGDVTQMDFLHEPFDFVLDIGCFHGVVSARRQNYASEIARLTRPGGIFMLYAFGPRRLLFRDVGVTPDQVKEFFKNKFAAERVEESTYQGEFKSAWYWFRKR